MNAIQTEVSDGSLVSINVGLEYFKQSDISVFLDLSTAPLVEGTDYAWANATRIDFLTGPVAVGVTVTLVRNTENEEMLNIYDGGAPFTRFTLDENFLQLLRLSQEFSEGLGLTGLRQALDMHGYRIFNLGDPLNAQDATTKAYVDLLIQTLVESGTGPIGAAVNVTYIDPAGQLRNLQQLSDKDNPVLGAALIGYMGTDLVAGLNTRFADTADLIADTAADLSADIADSQVLPSPRGGNLATSVKLGIKTLGAVGRTGLFHTAPSGFDTRFGDIWYCLNGSGDAYLVSNLDKYKPAGAFATPETAAALGLKAYYVSTVGSDAAAGTTWATALRTVAAASQKSDVDVIFVAGGRGANYLAAQHIGTYVGTRDIAIHAVGGRVRFISGPQANTAPGWNVTGVTGVYKQNNSDSALTGVVALDYTDEAGNPLTLLPAPDVNGVGLVPGSWFRSATELFISLPNFDVPTSNILYYQSAPMRVTGDNKKFYCNGVDFVGGNAGAFSARNGGLGTVIFMENCGFCGQANGDGFQIKNLGLAIAVRCRASRNSNDGLNYHAPDGVGSVAPHFIEVNCIGMANRAAGTGNGSTSHEDVKGLRIGCSYSINAGPGVADVNDAQTYNVGVTSRDSGPSTSAYGFVASSDAKVGVGVRMFLHGCVADANAGEDVRAQNSAAIMYRDVWSGRDTISVDGTSSATPF